MARTTSKEGVLLGSASRASFAAAFAATLLFSGIAAWAQQYTISTIAGGIPPPTPAVATNASIGQPLGIAVDASRNVYFTSLNSVFKIDGTGTLTRIAGTGRVGFSGDGGPAVDAQLNISQDYGVASGWRSTPPGISTSPTVRTSESARSLRTARSAPSPAA
jgi:hypothetical protein